MADSHNPFESLGCTIWSRIYFVAHSKAFPPYTICTRDGNLQRQLLFGEKLRTETLSSLSFCGEPEEKVLTSSDRTSFNETESTTEIPQLMLFPCRPRQALHRNFARSQSLGWRIVGKLLSHSPSDNAEKQAGNSMELGWCYLVFVCIECIFGNCHRKGISRRRDVTKRKYYKIKIIIY